MDQFEKTFLYPSICKSSFRQHQIQLLILPHKAVMKGILHRHTPSLQNCQIVPKLSKQYATEMRKILPTRTALSVNSKYCTYMKNVFMFMKQTLHNVHHATELCTQLAVPNLHCNLHTPGSTVTRITSVFLLGMPEHRRNSVDNSIWLVLVLLCSKKPLKKASNKIQKYAYIGSHLNINSAKMEEE